MLGLVGCDRHIESADPDRLAPEAPPVPIHLISRINDRSITLSWELSDSAAVDKFRLYRADRGESDFDLVDSTSDYSIVVTDLPFDEAVRLRLTTVSTDKIESEPSDDISVSAGLMAMRIDTDAEYTNDRNVSVEITVPSPAAYVELSEDSTFAGVEPRAFNVTQSFELSAGDGPKTVYVRITFNDGQYAGEIISDDIILDTEAMIDSVYFSPIGQTFAAGDTVWFFVAGHDELGGEARVSFEGVSTINLRDDGIDGDVVADDGFYSKLYIVPVGLTIADGEVSGTFTDAAGNSAVEAQALELINIQNSDPPVAVTLAASLIDSTTAQLTWTRNEDDDFASYRIYRSVTVDLILVSQDHLMQTILTDQGTVSHNDYLQPGSVFYYRIFVFDAEGRSTGSNQVVVAN